MVRQLIEKVGKDFTLADDTEIANTSWLVLKDVAMAEAYQQSDWYTRLDEVDRLIVQGLRIAEQKEGTNLEPQSVQCLHTRLNDVRQAQRNRTNQKKAELIHEKRFAMLLDCSNLSKEKKQLLVNAFKSKFKKLSDDTKIACKPWHKIKDDIMCAEQSEWASKLEVNDLESKDREVLERLTVAQA